MQQLRFYPEIHIDYTASTLGRLLFEGVDCYLYVWITSAMEVDSFQFVIADTQVLMFKRPESLSFLEIGREPFARALSGELTAARKKNLQRILTETSSQEFPDLLRIVVALGQGQKVDAFGLEKSELDFMTTLRV